MIPTGAQILTAARGAIGDTQVSGGQIFTDTFFTDNKFFQNAYEALYKYLQRNGHKVLRRSYFYNLPAYTSYITPAGMGLDNCGTPLEVYDRPVTTTVTATSLAVTARTAAAPSYVTVTCSGAHGLSDGAQVVTFGFGLGSTTQITFDVNGMWNITVPGSTTLRLLGCAAVDLGSASAATGIVSTSAQAFGDPLQQDYDLIVEATTPSSANASLTRWEWEGSAFRFVPANAARQIRVVYDVTGEAPSFQGNIGIDGSLNAMSLYLAGLAAASKLGTQSSLTQSLFMRAVGNQTGDTDDVRGGEFRALARLGMKALNQTLVRIPRFRPKRNVYPLGVWPVS